MLDFKQNALLAAVAKILAMQPENRTIDCSVEVLGLLAGSLE